MHRIWNEWLRNRSGSLARNAAWMVPGQVASYPLQGSYFVMLARLFGALEYGAFAGADPTSFETGLCVSTGSSFRSVFPRPAGVALWGPQFFRSCRVRL